VLATVVPLEALLTGLALIVAHDRKFSDVRTWKFDKALTARLTRETWPLALSGLLLVASTHVDKLLLGQWRGPREVGIYFAAYQLSGLWYFLSLIVSSSGAPDLARCYSGGEDEEYKALQHRLYSALTAAALTIAIVASFFAEEIVELLFGPAFRATADVLRIHVWTGIFVFHMHLRTRIFVIEGKQRFVLAFSLLTLIANLIMNACWIGPYGTQGAAWSAVLSSAMCVVVFPLFSVHTRTTVSAFLASFNPLSWWSAAATAAARMVSR
jgi:PST family polysaccharide transporter